MEMQITPCHNRIVVNRVLGLKRYNLHCVSCYSYLRGKIGFCLQYMEWPLVKHSWTAISKQFMNGLFSKLSDKACSTSQGHKGHQITSANLCCSGVMWGHEVPLWWRFLPNSQRSRIAELSNLRATFSQPSCRVTDRSLFLSQLWQRQGATTASWS